MRPVWTRSVLRILPRSGSTAWKARSRPCFAEPPAESPSTRRSSDFRRVLLLAVGELARQRRHAERVLADRVAGACGRRRAPALRGSTFSTTFLASPGFSSSQTPRPSLTRLSTTGRTSEETSRSLVCDENFGSGTLTETMAVSPSRQSSPTSETFSLLQEARGLGVAGDLARQRGAEARQVRAAVALRDVVREAQDGLVDTSRSTTARPRRRCRRARPGPGSGAGSRASSSGRDSARRPRCRPRRTAPRASARHGAASVSTMRTPELRKASSRSRCSSVP